MLPIVAVDANITTKFLEVGVEGNPSAPPPLSIMKP